uniref:ZZ-type zinc finger-containing protein 3 n=1 Tax=Esox lucius TaxID=8010 RepID=A0A6Q2XVP1_ESOLU
MAASRSSRVTRSSVGLNGLDENFCGRTLRNRSIAQPEEGQSSPLPGSRAPRSPKKRQDGQLGGQVQQASEKPGGHPGKAAEHKASSTDGETWACPRSPRKRGLSCSDGAGGGSEKAENCEGRGKTGAGREASPLLKRAKRFSRSEESQVSEDEPPPAPPEPPSEISERADPLRQNSTTMNSNSHNPTAQSLNSNSHKSSNGLGQEAETDTLVLEPPASANTQCPGPVTALLNGNQTASPCPSTPDPIVPSRNFDPGQGEEQGMEQGEEQELDGPGGNGQDSVATSINNIINSVNSLSGESPPPLAPPTPSNLASEPFSTPSPPSFTEPYEHRYTLRTSPRRATCGGGLAGAPSSPEPGSPPREVPLDNGPLREAGREATLVTGPPPPSATTEHGNTGASGDMVGGRGLGDLPDTAVSKAGKEVLVGGSQLDDEDEEEEEPDVYYFESDHLTLKHNKDYQRLLQTIGVLEAQRIQAILDLEQLARQQREALQDPITFVEQLQKQVELGLPRPQRVVQLPGISWDQYTSGLGDFEREFCDKKRKTRRLKLIFDKVGLPAGPKSPVEPKKEGESSTLYSALPSSDAPENNSSSQMIRGRLCHQNKPDTFNQLWTVEEQKKLEQLLLKFPPEEVESKRWQKIADALGNRTAKQVASRVQKYFIKLTKAGIPVPGRTPNMCMYSKKVSNKKQHHLNKHLYRPSTFLTSYEPPVYMEEDERAAHYHTLQDPSGDDSDEEGVPLELRHLPEYKELLELKRMKKHKLQEIQSESSTTIHHGYKCDVCGVEPIQGVRWHCQDCPSDNAVDFCSNCSDCLFQTERHHPSHHLEPVYHHTFLDKDYCLAQTPGYNYLDPNYYPANR